MNVRVKQLIKQAMSPSGDGGLGGTYLELNPEKLVELVVKECMECCYHLGRDSGPITADLNKIRISTLLEGI